MCYTILLTIEVSNLEQVNNSLNLFSNSAKTRKAIHKNQQRMDEQNYRTVGELFYRDSRFRPNGLFSPYNQCLS